MAGKAPERSNLIDVTYHQIHSILCGQSDGTSSEQLKEYLTPRRDQLKSIANPFGTPSDASRKKINSGSVTLADGVHVRVEDAEKDYVFAVSSAFEIDEVQALVLFRSFLYNEGLPPDAGSNPDASLLDELVQAITPFYFSERVALFRTFIPLFRAREDPSHPFHDLSISLLTKLLPDGTQFAKSLLTEYRRKLTTKPSASAMEDRNNASRWAKQFCKEQLVLLEVLFWTMWGSVACDGPMVVEILEAAYSTNLGTTQTNATLLLDDEGSQLQRDCSALWTLITIEILELENVAEPGAIEISENPSNMDMYTSSPNSLKRIHELVSSHSSGPFICTYLAWTFVISRLSSVASQLKQVPESYRTFLQSILSQREPAQTSMTRACLDQSNGLFGTMHSLLTSSPLFVTSVAWRTGSSVTDPNAIAYRSVLKGLVIAVVELSPVELIPDFDGLVEVWVDLFGRSESPSISAICRQFWQSDWYSGISRRAIFDVARTRFPIQVRPLVRLLRAMTSTGFLDTDPLCTGEENKSSSWEEQEFCKRHVFYFLHSLSTYSQVIPVSTCTGAHALYEKPQERYGASSSSPELIYKNLRELKLPGGTILPRNSSGRVLSGDGGEFVVVAWMHEHSGWKLLLDVLTEYVVVHCAAQVGGRRGFRHATGGRTDDSRPLSLSDIGLETEGGSVDEALVTDILDLVRSLIQDSPAHAQLLLQSLEVKGIPHDGISQDNTPDLVQLTSMILEAALSRSGRGRNSPPTRLITSAMSVLSAILAIPRYCNRVWIYIRSTSALFGSDRSPGFSSVALAAERVTGNYTMTLALLQLVQHLFREASLLRVPDDPELRVLKYEVLLRAVRFVHSEIWVEHQGWKYAQLGDRFEIGKRVASLYVEVLQHSPEDLDEGPFTTLSQAVLDLLLFKAATSTINPLVSSISSGSQMLQLLYSSRRFGDARRLIFLLESHICLTKLILHWKSTSSMASKPSLLEQALCARVTGGIPSYEPSRNKVHPIGALAAYVKERDVGEVVPLEAVKVLSALCVSLASCQPPPTTLVGHLSNPEAVVASFVRIVQHPYDDMALRYSVWAFISLAMDKEPALASLLISGKFQSPGDIKGKGKERAVEDNKIATALSVARDTLANWEALWDLNPQLLAAALRFLDAVWMHGLEHRHSLEALQSDANFWQQITALSCAELGPLPDYETHAYVQTDGRRHSEHHDIVANHAYRTAAKAYALHTIGLDIRIHLETHPTDGTRIKPTSFVQIEGKFKSEDALTELLMEAAPNSYKPELYDQLTESLTAEFPGLSVPQLQSLTPLEGREFGDDFAFSTSLLRSRLRAYQSTDGMVDHADIVEKLLLSLNLNLSLMHTQKRLTESWQSLLQTLIPYLRGDNTSRPILLTLAASISSDISQETRQGDMAATIYGTRLSFLLAILELVWFSPTDKAPEVESFIELAGSIRNITLNEHQSPAVSFLYSISTPFHRPLLQLLYFCARFARTVLRNPKMLTADWRLKLSLMTESSLNLVIDALQIVFTSARSRVDTELDQDMELLVSVFEQCTKPDVNPSSALWLNKCQERDVIKASLDLYIHTDLVGLSDLALLVTRKRPLYAPHLLLFHMCLASLPSSAERFATDGVLSAYSNTMLSPAISAGQIDVALPELPGLRSPAHQVYCSMISVVSGVILAMGRHNHYFDGEACGLVQLYGDQIVRAMSWTIGDLITLPLLEEIEQVIHLFYAIAESAPTPPNTNPAVEKVLSSFSPLALHLLQQLNYAVTHPNHLASLFDPVAPDERSAMEKESTTEDVLKRPMVAHLMHRMHRLTSNVIAALISISRADDVLIGEQDIWPIHQTLVFPQMKVVLNEPASMGTLLELGASTMELLKDLVARPSGQSLIAPSDVARSGSTLDVKEGVITARRTFESVVVYAVTQLAMWLLKRKPDSDTSNDAEMDSDFPEERRFIQPNLLSRGVTEDVVLQLKDLLSKAHHLIKKSDGIVDKDAVDLTPILSKFLQDRIAAPLRAV